MPMKNKGKLIKQFKVVTRETVTRSRTYEAETAKEAEEKYDEGEEEVDYWDNEGSNEDVIEIVEVKD